MNDQLNTNAGGNQATGNDDASHEGVKMVTNPPKTRGPYDGSYAHGVTADLEHINTILGYEKALARLKTRRNFLVKEYQAIGTKYSATEDVVARASLLKDTASKDKQITDVGTTRDKLLKLEDKIKAAEREAQASMSFDKFEIED
ncbi:MAG: hypothetical protein HOB84_05975 [Candidatus Marinimicrobia bacterium]|nr:hypothetical protein [Candidatus Neomarinimicrobiota bacterium]MBT4036304.1 hypothetical protein [Candidatus Neomarinimicrobiota bacterium]MBT4294574.1 hypothetical protein [Candidatus Neomarinimicrobiota bacterium]MBT4714301.1 hypothetical protein [Candidatus Neomarinimicrobiota bacterium]MBT5465448.1 hypothetical protein [Candidatus Neomarinimicrobiota bacterium]